MTQPSDSPSADLLARLFAYAEKPRGNRSGRIWTVQELLSLLDPKESVAAIAERMGIKRAVVTYELVRMRRAGFVVPDRPMGTGRLPRTIAIENDLRVGMIVADVARKYGVTAPRVREIRDRAGIPVRRWRWTDQERQLVIVHQDRPTPEVAKLIGRSVSAVDRERSQLIAQELVRPKITRPRKRPE